MSEFENLQILDELGFPQDPNKILFSSPDNILIYSFGSNIIYYNLNNNTKTFLQLSIPTEICILKFIDKYNQILLTIDNNISPVLNIWDLQTFQNIFNQEISTKNSYGIYFSTSNIFVEKAKNDLFIIFISSLTCNDYIIYTLYLSNNEYVLEPFSIQINQITNEKNASNQIIGFKYFLNSQISIIIYKSSIEFCEFDFNDKTLNSIKTIDYNFNILPNSISVSNEYNLISFISSKGSCLVYDINLNHKSAINPYNQDDFTVSYFYQDSLYLGTNTGKVFVYQLSDYNLKYYISYNKIYFLKKKFQLNNKSNNNDIDEEYDYDGPSIDYLDCDEKNDKIFIKMGDNSILLSPISFIIDNNNGYITEKTRGQPPLLIAYNHSQNIIDIEISEPMGMNDGVRTIFYTCSKDQKLIKYFIEHKDNKLYNQFFDFNDIFSENIISKNNFNKYYNVMKFHSKQKNYLYLGDNKGYIYILDTNKNKIIYKQFISEAYAIDSLSFNSQGTLICISYETGMEVIYYINNSNSHQKFEKYLALNQHYFSPQEIEFRQRNNHILSFSYFFGQNKSNGNKIIYMKNTKNIECSMLIEKRTNYKEIMYSINMNYSILDIKVHKSEKYIIVLDDNLQINIYNLINRNNIGIIDLSEQVKFAYNLDIDISGLYLSLLCQVKGNKKEKSDIVLFEVGTGNVYSFISGMNSITKTKFDYSGKYLITTGNDGEVTILGLDEDITNSIKNVILNIKKNSKFLEEYSILFTDNNQEFNYEIKLNNKRKSIFENSKQPQINQKENGDNSNIFKKISYNKNNYNKLSNDNSEYSYMNNIDKRSFKRESNYNNFSNKSYNFKNKANNLKYSNIINSGNIFSPQIIKSQNLNTLNSISSQKSNSLSIRNKYNYTFNKYSNVPKLSHINIATNGLNTFGIINNNNKNNRLFACDKIMLNSYFKSNKDKQIKNINDAISALMNDDEEEKEKEKKEYKLNVKEKQNEKPIKFKDENFKEKINMNKFSFTNNLLNNNLSSFYSNETDLRNKNNLNSSKDSIAINNKKANNQNNSDSINSTFLIYQKDPHKKYPEPKDIDDIENCYFINNNINNLNK